MGSPPQTTPPRSRTSSRASQPSPKPPMSLDLSDLPPLVQPSPPSNTLLVTNLNDPTIFAPSTLSHVRDLIDNALHTAAADPSNSHASTPLTAADTLHSFSPLPSLRRIVLTFTSTAAATHLRSTLDGLSLASGDRIRVYFGAQTQLADRHQHLQAPAATKQFFISPPPSPPAGWTSKEEDPPNKEVHAADLAIALSQLGDANVEQGAPKESVNVETSSPKQAVEAQKAHVSLDTSPIEGQRGSRVRSDSRTIVYQPEEHGNSPDLPAIAVEDTTESPVSLTGADSMEGGSGSSRIIAHTSRPPVELM